MHPNQPMLHALNAAESKLSDSGLEPFDQWRSLHIDYHPPEVLRLYRDDEDSEFRILLHKILPCGVDDALYHPHPWPSAIKILSGEYEMKIGTSYMEAGQIRMVPESVYVMTDPMGWHGIAPITTVYSLMVIGEPWEHDNGYTRPMKVMGQLSDADRIGLLEEFSTLFSE